MVLGERSAALVIVFLLIQTMIAPAFGDTSCASPGNSLFEAEVTTPQTNESGFSWETDWWIPTLCIVLVLLIGVVIAVVLYFCVCRKKKKKGSTECSNKIPSAFSNQKTDPAESGALTPQYPTPSAGPPSVKLQKKIKDQMIQPGKIDKEHFTFLGPLKVDAGVKGPRHALEGEKSHSLKDIVFDDAQNVVRFIGSNVEFRETSPLGSVTMEDNDNTLEALKSKELGVTRSADTLHNQKSKETVGPTKSSDVIRSREGLKGDLKVDKTQERSVRWSMSKSKDKGFQKKKKKSREK